MTKKMKVIMENWDRFILQEEFEACDTPFKVGDMMAGVVLAEFLDDEEKQQQLENSKLGKFMTGAKKLARPLASLGLSVAAIGATGGTAAALTAAGVAEAAGSVMGEMFALGSKNEGDNKYTDFSANLCVDNETLDLIEDKFQQQYVTQTDIVDKLQDYFKNANPESPLPDITEHLVEWLNTKSAYAGSEETKMVTK